ncbi:Craniofacial development protein 2 [Eumeta japonica]|uniref:Craniofacial development protein 2 n=1 Tax=Eumeta variegata TaxID=151549 RepID=A0A4C1TPF8_EUMVA|nr:Craniofacial development protein 2 [Eumeta japonica]
MISSCTYCYQCTSSIDPGCLDPFSSNTSLKVEENKNLKLKVENLEKKVEYLEREKKSNNIIIHGLLEEGKSTLELLENLKKMFIDELGISIGDYENKQLTQQNQIILPPRLVTEGEIDHHPLTKGKKLYIATFNTKTLRTPEALLELEKALMDLKWDILSISELRRAGESIEEHAGYILFNKGKTGGQRGVGFMVKTHLRKHIKGFIGVTDRISTLHITTPSHKKTWTIIQAYSPTELADKTEHQSFYDKLDQVISDHSNDIIILMGDFNAQVGAEQSNDEYELGKLGHGKRSENGQRLIYFLLEHNLILLNSLFKKNVINKWTWISPDRKYKKK